MFKIQKNKNIYRLFSGIALVQMLFWQASPAFAGLFGSDISIPSSSEIASQLEQRYNLNLDSLRDQGQNFNVIDQKKINPQVSISFSPSDPKVGQKITALALPIYFSNSDDQLYYTWYLKHKGCDLEKNVGNATKLDNCDLDNDGDVTVEDWKIEAMRTYASNNFDYAIALSQGLYGIDNDNDGYDVARRFGGNDQVNVNPHCYYHDNASGENFEIASKSSKSFSCPNGQEPACMYNPGVVGPGECDLDTTGGTGGDSGGGGTGGTGGDASASCDTFITSTPAANLYVSGIPYCNAGVSVQCYLGTPCCVTEPASAQTACASAIDACDNGTSSNDLTCKHLFPKAPASVTGNGAFDGNEEQFWHTNPQDPSTNDNGNKDEANVVGLGATKFSWNYAAGDLLGVVVEGMSIVPTKYNDSSNMVMWAFSKNKCPISHSADKGTYLKTIKGYQVSIPTIGIDLNDCLEGNLVDPTLGGQATNLEVDISATPENPQDDTTGGIDGDTLEAVANINNAAKSLNDTYFDWKVQIAPNGNPNTQQWVTITGGIQALPNGKDLLSNTKGNAVSRLRLKLNLNGNDVVNPIGGAGNRVLSDFVSGNVGYLRFIVDAAENYSANVNRKGNAGIVVKFLTSGDKIRAYTVTPFGDPSKVTLDPDEICSGVVNPLDPPDKQALDKLEAKLCRVLSSEIIGLKVDNVGNTYSNFNWTINDKPLICNTKVSPLCFDDRQGNVNFFPVIGNPGETFTINVTANKISTDPRASDEKTVTISRTFKIVTPEVQIISGDPNTAWPKILGQYKDAQGNTFADKSQNTLEALTGSNVILQAQFIPTFLKASFPPKIERDWAVDDQRLGDGSSNQIAFTTNKPDGSIYNVSLAVVYRPTDGIRKALEDIWGISTLTSTEQYFGTTTQLEHPANADQDIARLSGPTKYLALISSYLPASLLFSIRVFLSIGLMLFASGLAFAVIPQAPEARSQSSRRW